MRCLTVGGFGPFASRFYSLKVLFLLSGMVFMCAGGVGAQDVMVYQDAGLKDQSLDLDSDDLDDLKRRGFAAINKLLVERDRLLDDREQLLEECRYLRNRLETFDGDVEAQRLRQMLEELERILSAGEEDLIASAEGTVKELQRLRREKMMLQQQLMQQVAESKKSKGTGLKILTGVAIAGLAVGLAAMIYKFVTREQAFDERMRNFQEDNAEALRQREAERTELSQQLDRVRNDFEEQRDRVEDLMARQREFLSALAEQEQVDEAVEPQREEVVQINENDGLTDMQRLQNQQEELAQNYRAAVRQNEDMSNLLDDIARGDMRVVSDLEVRAVEGRSMWNPMNWARIT